MIHTVLIATVFILFSFLSYAVDSPQKCKIPSGVSQWSPETLKEIAKESAEEDEKCKNPTNLNSVEKYFCGLERSTNVTKTRFEPNADCTKLRYARFSLESDVAVVPAIPSSAECENIGCGTHMSGANNVTDCCELKVTFSQRELAKSYCDYNKKLENTPESQRVYESGFAMIDRKKKRLVVMYFGEMDSVWVEHRLFSREQYFQSYKFETPEIIGCGFD